jgi:hypothetical protein
MLTLPIDDDRHVWHINDARNLMSQAAIANFGEMDAGF